jgi:hypothetical protein
MADTLSPVTVLTPGRFILRVAWIAARLIAAYYLGHTATFVYQGF